MLFSLHRNAELSGTGSIPEKDFGLNRNGFLICHIARFDPIKGQKDLLLAFRHVVKTVPDARLLMVGDGQMRRDLQNLVQELQLREHVFFLGFRQDIQSLLSISDCFVLSSFSEGLPLSVLEAMVAGVPVVATRVGGLDEIIEDGTDGLLVPSRNPDRLAEAILSIRRDPEHAKKMGRNGREKVSGCFSAETMVEAVEDVYISIGEQV
jgi:glycosyltransferase involved in cell wall biosynthesis